VLLAALLGRFLGCLGDVGRDLFAVLEGFLAEVLGLGLELVGGRAEPLVLDPGSAADRTRRPAPFFSSRRTGAGRPGRHRARGYRQEWQARRQATAEDS